MKYNKIAAYINECINEKKFQQILERVFLKRGETDFVAHIHTIAPSTVTKWVEKLYWYLNGLKEYPKCEMCDNRTTFIKINEGYRRFCSTACIGKCADVLEKRDNTMMDKYGVKYALSAPDIREKIKHTCLERYGVESSNQSAEVKEKMKQTMLDRYGVDNSSKSEDVKKKKRKNNLEKYGYEYASQRPEIKEKIQNTNLERFGAKTPIGNANVRAKMEATNMERYGVVNVLSSQEIINKRINTVKDAKLVIINDYLAKDNLKLIAYNDETNIIRCECTVCNQESDIKFQLLYLRHKSDRTICTVCNPLYDKNTSYDEQELLQFIRDNYDG